MTARVLSSQVGRNVLTYVDDIIVKSTKQENHITNLQETFSNFRKAGLKLNLEKCVFGVKKGKFLVCLVSTKGIEANPSKIEVILWVEPPKSIKRCPKIDRKVGIIEYIYFKISREELAILRSAEISQSLSMGTNSAKGFQRDEAISNRTDNIDSTFIRSPIATVCSCFSHCS
jgi:hypothetical protein